MKAFLMYRDRDFDPLQLLSRRDRDSRASAKDKNLSLQQILPSNEAALTQDLGLDILFNAMAQGDNFLFEVATVALLSSVTDPQIILYRERILEDCTRNEAIAREMYQIACEAIAEERKHYWGHFIRYPVIGSRVSCNSRLATHFISTLAMKRAHRHWPRCKTRGSILWQMRRPSPRIIS